VQFLNHDDQQEGNVKRKRLLAGVGGAVLGMSAILAASNPAFTTPTVQANVAAYEQLLADVYGTPADRRAGEKVADHKMQQAIKVAGRTFGLRRPGSSSSPTSIPISRAAGVIRFR
jgi:hypothetical protein